MSADTPEPQDEMLTARIAAYDDALAAGELPPDAAADLPADLRARLEHDLEYVRLLRQVLAPAPPVAPAAPPDSGPGEESPGGKAGTRVGRFEVRRELGRGGFGVVFLAFDPALGREVALKVPQPNALASSEMRERFRREGRAAAGLAHPNLVAVHEVGEEGPVCFLVSAYCPGPSLAQWLKERREPVPFRLAASLVATLAGAVQHAHGRGVLHRDLKPANVLLQVPAEDSPAGSGDDLGFVPKVTDFGLAKLIGRDGEGPEPVCRTQTGVILGTPNYMAPEQAGGKIGEVGRAADVHALGTILYELLVGRPPFQGETDLDTLLQVQSDEPVPPSRLRPRVPRDLETVCLKCLEKAPPRRYASAQELADDLRRFLDGRPIVARPAGRLERAWRWARRNPREAAIGALLVSLVLLGLGGAWAFDRWGTEQALQRQQARQYVEEDTLARLPSLRKRFRWGEAAAALARAEREVDHFKLGDLRQPVRQSLTDLRIAERLDQIRQDRAQMIVNSELNFAAAGPAYREAFKDYGLDLEAADVEELARRVLSSAVREELVVALDDWAAVDPEWRARLLDLAGRVDPGPWKDRLREAVSRQEVQAVKALAGEADVAGLTPAMLAWVGGNYLVDHEEGLALLRAAQWHHPTDFWVSFHLGSAFDRRARAGDKGRWAEAIAYYGAALAVRPDSPLVHSNLAAALKEAGRADETVAAAAEAVRLRPDHAAAHLNHGAALAAKGQWDKAIDAYGEVNRLQPGFAKGYCNLGNALRMKGRLPEAVAACEKAIDLKPDFFEAHNNLGAALAASRLWDKAIVAFRDALSIKEAPETYYNLGVAYQRKGRPDDAIDAYRQAIRLKLRLPAVYGNLATALVGKGELDQAIDAYREALSLNKDYHFAHTGLGDVFMRKGQWDEAIDAYRKAVLLRKADPEAHCSLANALRRKGLLDQAIDACRDALLVKPGDPNALCIRGQALMAKGKFGDALDDLRRGHQLGSATPDWHQPSEHWVRECERLHKLDLKLPAVLSGKEKPEDADEGLGLAELCLLYKNRNLRAARLYADALASGPRLPADALRGHRHNAAAAAALVAAGKGEDVTGLSEEDRARLRKQALEWLRSNLKECQQLLEKDDKAARTELQAALRQWQEDAALASVRDEEALGRLPEAERQAWGQFWKEVAALLKE